jgi:uncharacterized Zn-binding protein involved in type VI secretion
VLLRVFLAFASIACFLAAADAQTPPPPSGSPIVEGSPDVSVGGLSVARQGDATKDGEPVPLGSPNVIINGKPAAVMGDGVTCGGGSPSVFVNGKPLARIADDTKGCAKR